MPDLPSAPSIPSPSLPSMPSAPSAPSLPGVPAPPGLPAPPLPMPGGVAGAILGATIGKNFGDPAVALRFHLNLDNQNIGWWNSFEGLGMETAIEQREEGGNNSWVHQLPTRLKFSNVKLSRPINHDSEKVAIWFMAISKKVTRSTAQIKAVDGRGTTIAQWSLNGVVPVRWTGPTFKVDSPQVATETIELAYHGFSPSSKPAGKD